MSDYKDYKDNLLYRISMIILEYIVISGFVVLVSICSLGILFFPSVSASYYYYYQREQTGLKLQFTNLFIGVKKNIKQSIPLGLVALLILYIGYVNISNVGLFGDSPIVYYAMLFGLAFLFLHNFYVLQLTTYFEVKLSRAVLLSTMFMMIYFISTITVVVLFIALILSVALQPALIVIILGLFIHVSSKVFMMIFKKHSPEEVNENEE